MRMLTISVRSVAAVVFGVALQACAAPERLPEQAAEEAIRALAEAEADRDIVLPNGVDKLKCTPPTGVDSDTKWVDSTGNALSTSVHTLIIPDNALKNRVLIHLKEGRKGDGKVVIVAAPPVTFPEKLPAALTLTFGHCTIPGENREINVYRAPGNNPNATLVVATINDTTKTATVELDHLSTYLMGAN